MGMLSRAEALRLIVKYPRLGKLAKQLAEDAKKLQEKEIKKNLITVIAPDVNKKTNDEVKGLLAKAERKRAEFQREKSTFQMYTVPTEVTLSGGWKADSPEINSKYEVAALFFFRIMCRTPYDEYYLYKVLGERNQKTYKTSAITKKSYTLKIDPVTRKRVLTLKESLREHNPDSNTVRNDWVMTLTNDDGTSVGFTIADFEGVSFESIGGVGYKAVAQKMMAKNENVKNFISMTMTNESDYIDVLEYGKYNKTYETKNTKESHKGANRYHGSNGGYSVQAPRGIMRITMQEFQDAQIMASEEGRTVTINDVRFNLSIPDDANASLKEALLKTNTDLFDEKDILWAMQKEKPHIPLSSGYVATAKTQMKMLREKRAKEIEENIKRRVEDAKKARDAHIAKRNERIAKRNAEKEAKKQAREEKKKKRAQELALIVQTKQTQLNAKIKAKQEERKKLEKQGDVWSEEIEELMNTSKSNNAPVFGMASYIDKKGKIQEISIMSKKGKIYVAEKIEDEKDLDAKHFVDKLDEFVKNVARDMSEKELIAAINETIDYYS